MKTQLEAGNVHIKQDIRVKDALSPKNICFSEVKDLAEVTIRDLEVAKIVPNTILWLKLIGDACNISSLKLIAEDKNKDVIGMDLFNQVKKNMKLSELQKEFPAGLVIGIK